jgi:hypothetical protein
MVKRLYIFGLACSVILLLLPTAVLAQKDKDSDAICDAGKLKGWARKQGYTQEDCEPVIPAINTAPVVYIEAPVSGAVLRENEAVVLQASVSDAEDGSGLTVSWSSSLDGGVRSGSVLTVGNHRLTAIATDSGGLSAQAVVDVIVEPVVQVNSAPVITIQAPADGSILGFGIPVKLDATAEDAEQGDLSSGIVWLSSIDGTIRSGDSLSLGEHRISAQVQDAEGLSASASVSLVVEAINEKPVLSIVVPTPGQIVDKTAAITLMAAALDAEDGDLSTQVKWHSSLDGDIPATPLLSMGSHVITATVTDSAGESSSQSQSLVVTEMTVESDDGVVTITWAAPTQRSNGEPLSIAEISGYEIYMIDEQGVDERVIPVNGANTLSYQIGGLSPGTYYFSMSTVDTAQLKSEMSEIISITIP